MAELLSRWAIPVKITVNQQVVILGAHWDTLATTDGFNDNGSGVAAVLEVATVLTASGCEFENSIMFVAFDLEEMGMQVRDRVQRSVKKLFLGCVNSPLLWPRAM